jgi:type IV pilus assembly protein PilB
MRKKKAKAATRRSTKARPKKQDAAPSPGEVLDLKSAADFLKVSKPTFYRWLAQGKIKGHKAGTQWRFYRSDLENFLRAEEPSALQVDADALRKAVTAARKSRGLEPIAWPEAETSEESTVIGTVNTLFADAIEARASDIHIDNNPDETLVRYRIDGVLVEAMRLPREASRPLISRLKLMADCNISERRLPQFGRIPLKLRDRDYDLRVATMPSVFGESAILRILAGHSVLIGLDKLGFSKPMQQAFERTLRAPTGLIIVAGPAGCGKTTTLYSVLNKLNSPEKKIVSIEDPVEYFIPDTMQVHVNRKVGLTHPFALRMFTRSDPDIILVGELRDLETAELSVRAAMTGHLVLTSMLPTDAPSVVTRLIDMGMEPFLVSASLVAVLAQRLARKVCPSCKTEYQPSPAGLRRMGMNDQDIARAKFHRGKGCQECRQTGHRGRTGIFELLEVDDRLRELIARPAPTAELRQAAIEAGMTTMIQDGLEKAKQGITTVEEVLRILTRP